jgi:hypothetical protein
MFSDDQLGQALRRELHAMGSDLHPSQAVMERVLAQDPSRSQRRSAIEGRRRSAQKSSRADGGGSWLATRRARWLAAAAVTAIAVPGLAYAAGVFRSPQIVAKSLPAGARIFGSTPTCTVVQPNVEYRCTLARAPSPDPIAHLSAQQWRKLLTRPPNLGKIKIVNRRTEITPGHWRMIPSAETTPRQERIYQSYKNEVLASFGFTPTQIKAHNEAVDADAAGIGAGQFKGTVEPTVDATHHIDGGCRAIDADGAQWECYIGQAAVKQKIVTNIGTYVPGPGVG